MNRRDIYSGADLNTAERAMNLLAHEPGAHVEGEAIVLRRKIAPAGMFSDGTRAIRVCLCERHRWALVTLGDELLAEVDHRNTWEQPGRMASSILAAIDDYAKGRAVA